MKPDAAEYIIEAFSNPVFRFVSFTLSDDGENWRVDRRTKPPHTIEFGEPNTRPATEALEARVKELEETLEFIADFPDPGQEQERSATFYRVHAAFIKQIAAKAIGRKVVSDEAMKWAEDWWNSEEAKEARKALETDNGE